MTEMHAKRDAELIGKYLEELGVVAEYYPGNSTLPELLKKKKPDMVINLVDSFKGQEYLSSTVPGVLDLLEIPYTGAGILGISLGNNKFLTNKLLQQNGIPVPNHQLFVTPTDYMNPTLRYPLISKLNEIHGAVEITKDAVSENEKHLRERLKYLISTYNQPILVEEFIVGREVTTILLEGLNKKVYMADRIIKSDDKFNFATFELQWLDEREDVITYKPYKDPLLMEYVKKAFNVTEMADYGKFDVRIDNSGRYFFIDSNPNPFLGPKEADAPIAYILEMFGVNFQEILKRLLVNTIRDAQGKEKLPFTSTGS